MKNFGTEKERNTDRVTRDFSDINDQIIIKLRNLSHVMRSLYEGKGSQKRILIVLDEIGDSITQHELTQRLGIKPGSASEVISKLESAGYITRRVSAADKRTVDIELTQAGKACAKQAKEQRIHRHEEMFSCLTKDEKKELLCLLEKVDRDWETRYRKDEHLFAGHGHHHTGIMRHKGK